MKVKLDIYFAVRDSALIQCVNLSTVCHPTITIAYLLHALKYCFNTSITLGRYIGAILQGTYYLYASTCREHSTEESLDNF